MHQAINAFAMQASGPATDPHFANTVLLLSGDGTNGVQTFTDESFANRGSYTASGISNDAQVSTAFKKFGTGSIRFDGVSDNIVWADSADWNFTGDFTWETWASFDPNNLGTEQNLIAQYESSGNQRATALRYRGELATNRLEFSGSSDGVSTALTVGYDWTPTADQFYHVAVDRNGNDFRLYIDGSMVAKVTQAITFHNSTAAFRIGSRSSGGAIGEFRGNQDEIRITKGVARYATDSGFAVPTSAYPRS